MTEPIDISWKWWDYVIIVLSALLLPLFTVIYAIIRMEMMRRAKEG